MRKGYDHDASYRLRNGSTIKKTACSSKGLVFTTYLLIYWINTLCITAVLWVMGLMFASLQIH